MGLTFIPDTTPPEVAAPGIAPGAMDVPIDGDFTFTFSEPMDTKSGWKVRLSKVDASSFVDYEDGVWTGNDTVLAVDYSKSGLEYGSTYQIELSGFRDKAGNAPFDSFVIGPFTTAQAPPADTDDTDDTDVTDVEKVFKVKFDANGGRIAISKNGVRMKAKSVTKNVTFGKHYGALKSPTRTGGYKFAGWYTQRKGGAKVTKNTKLTTDKTHTLYAHWRAQYGKVTGCSFVYVRSKPSLHPNLLPVTGILKAGKTFKIQKKIDRKGKTDDWYKIRYNGKDAYVYAKYVTVRWA
jgi:uncharacterized repeat protein (TIGR02543 family)